MIFTGGFDQDFNVIFLEDATATEDTEMHKVIRFYYRYTL